MDLAQRIANITAFVVELDGVLTDGKILCLESGPMLRQMNAADSLAFRLAAQHHYFTAVFSEGNSEGVLRCLNNWNVGAVFFDTISPKTVLDKVALTARAELGHIAFLGCEHYHAEAMMASGCAVCPADAPEDIRQLAHYVTKAKAGEGVFREFAGMVLRARGDWTKP